MTDANLTDFDFGHESLLLLENGWLEDGHSCPSGFGLIGR